MCRSKTFVRRLGVLLFALWGAARSARADVALLVEDPSGHKAFWSDSGHVSVWIEHACVGNEGVVVACAGNGGTVLSSTSYWMRHGWAAVPAQLYFEGVPGELEETAWTGTMGEMYPELPASLGRKYVDHLKHRGAYVIRIHTTAAEDAHAVQEIQRGRGSFRYTVLSNNCSDFARKVLDVYFLHAFDRRLLPDFGMTTPSGIGNRLFSFGRHRPELKMEVYYVPPRMGTGSVHHGFSKSICEAAVTDPKYAVPLLFYQPVVYAAFGACYVATAHPRWLHGGGFRRKSTTVATMEQADETYAAMLHAAEPVVAGVEAPADSAGPLAHDAGTLAHGAATPAVGVMALQPVAGMGSQPVIVPGVKPVAGFPSVVPAVPSP